MKTPTRLLGAFLLMLGAWGPVTGCSMESPAAANNSAGSGNQGVTMRGVVGDFCPPAQATKGNC